MKFVGGVFSYEAAGDDEDGTWCDWWLDRRPPVPAHALVGRGGLPARRDHGQPDHDGRHAQGLLGPEGAPRGHGRQPRRRVARVPELPALLRPDVRRAQGQGARRPLREGLQRLDVRRVVRGHQRPAHPADHRAALGLEARGRGDPPQRGAWLPRGHVLARSRRSSGFPSIHDKDGYWDPFLAACEETDTVINMHIGSSSKMPSTSADAPAAVGSTLTYMNAAMSLTDWLMSGVFERFPTLTIAYSEGQIGWIPYVLERADKVWEDNRGWGGVADKVKRPPSEYYFEHVYGCFFDDPHGLRSLDERRRGQRHVRDRLPAQRQHLAAHQEGRRGADEGPHPGAGRQDLPRQRDPHAPPRERLRTGVTEAGMSCLPHAGPNGPFSAATNEEIDAGWSSWCSCCPYSHGGRSRDANHHTADRRFCVAGLMLAACGSANPSVSTAPRPTPFHCRARLL